MYISVCILLKLSARGMSTLYVHVSIIITLGAYRGVMLLVVFTCTTLSE